MANIGITGTGSLIGQAIIKSIKQSSFKNERLIGIDYFTETIGSYWTDKNYILPDILDKDIPTNGDLYWAPTTYVGFNALIISKRRFPN